MLFWCEPKLGPTWEPPAGFVERRATLALSPLDIEPTPSGTPFRIPPPFLPARPGVTDQGKSNAFDSRRGEWVKGLTTSTDTLLRFQLPNAVLPCTLDRGRLTIRVNAPSRDVTVGAFRDGQPIVLERFNEPNGVFEIDLAPEHLAVDGGTVPISIVISRTVAERAEDARGEAPALDKKQYEQQIDTSVSSTWDIDYVRLSVDGRTN